MWYRNYLFFYKHCILYPNKIVFLENFPALTSRAKPHQLMCCRWMMVMIMAPALQQQHPTGQPASHPGGGGVELGASNRWPLFVCRKSAFMWKLTFVVVVVVVMREREQQFFFMPAHFRGDSLLMGKTWLWETNWLTDWLPVGLYDYDGVH